MYGMADSKKKDLRLWDRGNSIIPFTTRGHKLAKELMKTVGLKERIIELFEEGKVLKTISKNPLSIKQGETSEKDRDIISDLNKDGLLVYHVLESYIMLGKQTEIKCEHEVSTYERVISTNSYLCVPKDIFTEALSFDEDITNKSNRELVIKDYIEHEIFLANQGYFYAYVVSDYGTSDFFNIGVNVFNGDIIRVS
jgi:hypothetical protein